MNQASHCHPRVSTAGGRLQSDTRRTRLSPGTHAGQTRQLLHALLLRVLAAHGFCSVCTHRSGPVRTGRWPPGAVGLLEAPGTAGTCSSDCSNKDFRHVRFDLF